MHWRFTPPTSLTVGSLLMLAMSAVPTFAQEETPAEPARREMLSDRVIGLAVEKELLSAEGINAHRIDAESRQGIVTLAGKVGNLRAKRRASEVAQHVKGVAAVVNQNFCRAGARSIAKRKAQVAGVENVDVRGMEVDADFFDGTRRRKRLEHRKRPR